MKFEQYMTEVDDLPGVKDKVELAYRSLLLAFDEKDFDFKVSKEKFDYGIRFIIKNNLYKDGTALRGEIQYNWKRDNLTDFNTCQWIDRSQFLVYCNEPKKVWYTAIYGDWIDRKKKYGQVYNQNGRMLQKGRMPGGQVLYKKGEF